MAASIDVILGQCIVAIQRGEMTKAECLQRYPQYEQELSVLLQTWQELVSSPAVAPSPAFRRIAKTRLQNRLASRQPVTFFDRLRHNWHRTTQTIKHRRTSMRLVTITIIALLLFVGSGAGVAYASEGALPGDPLYSAKTTIEGVRLAFSDSDGDVELYNEFANERV